MVSVRMEQKQENGRYRPVPGLPITDPATVYKYLAQNLYRHSLNRHCNRIKATKIDDSTMQFVVTFNDGNRFVYTVDNIGFR